MRALTRPELTAALAARQMLIERRRVAPAVAIRRLTPLQGQHAPAPFIALAARIDGFTRASLEAALARATVVKTTIMRVTLHLAAAIDYPAYAQVSRQVRMRTLRKRHPGLDAMSAELAEWLAEAPRANEEIRAFVWERFDGIGREKYEPIWLARTVLPLVQLPPAGFWHDKRRPLFAVDPRPLPSPGDAAALALRRYLAAFGPASRRDVAAWAGVAQTDFAEAFERLPLVSYRGPDGGELLDLPRAPLPPATTSLPVRLLAHWDQPLLAYAPDARERILPAELGPLGLTLSGDPTVTVDGRVAASWAVERGRDAVRLTVTPHVELSRRARSEIRAEAAPMARFEVAGV